MAKYSNFSLGQIEALINILGGEEAVLKILKTGIVQVPQYTLDQGGWFKVKIDFNRSLAERLSNPYVRHRETLKQKLFQNTQRGVVEQKLRVMMLDTNSTYPEAICEMSTRGLVPATLDELIAAIPFFTGALKGVKIVALGSMAQREDQNDRGTFTITQVPMFRWNTTYNNPEIELATIEISNGSASDYWGSYVRHFLVKEKNN